MMQCLHTIRRCGCRRAAAAAAAAEEMFRRGSFSSKWLVCQLSVLPANMAPFLWQNAGDLNCEAAADDINLSRSESFQQPKDNLRQCLVGCSGTEFLFSSSSSVGDLSSQLKFNVTAVDPIQASYNSTVTVASSAIPSSAWLTSCWAGRRRLLDVMFDVDY